MILAALHDLALAGRAPALAAADGDAAARAIMPARRASRLNVLDALHYE